MKSIGLALMLLLAHQGYSMEFRWGAVDEAKADPKASKQSVIYANGAIQSGDFDRLRALLRKDFEVYIKSSRTVRITSNGGDIVEAIKIGGLLKEMYAEVVVDGDCASACFLLYVSAVERKSFGRVGIHRPYFEPRYFAGLRPADAEKKHLELTDALNRFLEKSDVPRSLIDKMNSTSSKEIYWLSEKDIEDVGRYPSWFEEFLLAKCSRAPDYWEELDMRYIHEKEWAAFSACRKSVIVPELRGHLRATVFRKYIL